METTREQVIEGLPEQINPPKKPFRLDNTRIIKPRSPKELDAIKETEL